METVKAYCIDGCGTPVNRCGIRCVECGKRRHAERAHAAYLSHFHPCPDCGRSISPKSKYCPVCAQKNRRKNEAAQPEDEDKPVLWWISMSPMEHVFPEPGDEMPDALLPPAVTIRRQQSCDNCAALAGCRAAVAQRGACLCERLAVSVREGVRVVW